jgi:predicted transcriptional regulator
MPKAKSSSGPVVSLRVSPELNRRLSAAARQRRHSRSETARAILEAALMTGSTPDPAKEAQRQSRLASRRASERDALDFIVSAADLRGWR